MKHGSYEEFEAEKVKCTDCPVGLDYGCVVPSFGNKKNPIVAIVGECPGKDELLADPPQPFVGKSGRLLRDTMNSFGFRMENTLITNTIPCRPLCNQFPTDKNVVDLCVQKWLQREVRMLSPRFVVLVGGRALKAVAGLDGITKQRGKWIYLGGEWGDENKLTLCMPTFHPSYVLRKQNMQEGESVMQQFKDDLRTVALAADFVQKQKYDEWNG